MASRGQIEEIITTLRRLDETVQRLEVNNSYTIRQQQFDQMNTLRVSLESTHAKLDWIGKRIEQEEALLDKDEMEKLFQIQHSALATQIFSQITHQLDTFLSQLDKKLDLQPLRDNLITLDANIRKAHTMIDKAVNRLLTHLENQNFSPVLQRVNEATENLLIKYTQIQDKIIDLEDRLKGSFYLSLVGEIKLIEKTYIPYFENLTKDIQHLKIMQREPINQEITHNKLNEIEKQICLLDIEAIQKEVMKIVEINITQDEFSRKLALAIKLEVRDRLVTIEEQLSQLTKQKEKQFDPSNILEEIKKIKIDPVNTTTTLSHSTSTYLLYSSETSPDKNHWIL